ncbi:hypothetical protein EDD85DRAFT_941667 [Armillaria nabsnona]|nr:hypothetical protein EDD85DRAFT_941667 [Armillaria nabsnona]
MVSGPGRDLQQRVVIDWPYYSVTMNQDSPVHIVWPHPKCVQVVCWWKHTKLHKLIIFAVPLVRFTGGAYPVHQKSPMPLNTRAVFTVEILLNIARGSLGGFYIPSGIDPEPRKNNIFRFTFHGQHPENDQKPGRRLSQEELSIPLKEVAVGQALWIKVKGSSPPTANSTRPRMQSAVEDKSSHPSNWVPHIKRHHPNAIARCPFTVCLSPIACHIIECGQNDQAYELIAKLSNDISHISCPRSPGEPGFLDVRYPIPKKLSYHDALASLSLVETYTNSMALERQFHETYQRYW